MSLLSKARKSRDSQLIPTTPVASSTSSTSPTNSIQKPTAYEVRFFMGENNIVLRSFIDESGIIWFVAQDLLRILEYPESTWKDPVIRRYFTCVPQNHTRIMPLLIERVNHEYEIEELYCVTESGIRGFLDLIWGSIVKPILALIDNDIVPFFRNISVVREFEWRHNRLRTTRDIDQRKVWFVLTDVLKALGYMDTVLKNPGKLLRDHGILDSQRNMITFHDSSSSTNTSCLLCVTEDCLYTLLAHNDNKDAQSYKEWVMAQVMPVWNYNGSVQEPDLPVDSSEDANQEDELPTAMDEWNRVALIPTDNDPEMAEYKQLLALRAGREQTGGINRPMWLVAGRTLTLDQLVTIINSYWLDRKLTKPQLVLWFKQMGYLEPVYANSNIPTSMARQKGVFAPFTFVYEDPQSGDAHLRADVKITDVGVEYFTTLCTRGEQFEPKPY